MANEYEFRIEGLQEALKDLRPTEIPKRWRKEQRQVVNSHVLPAARANLAGLSHVPGTKTAVSTYASSTSAGLQINRARFPWVAGAEFGSLQYSQFKRWVGNQYTGAEKFPGYFVGPAIKSNITKIEQELMQVLEDLFLGRR